jgi:AAA domain
MAAKLVRPTDAIEVKHLGVLIYGQPGSRKTSAAQTCDSPMTLAFDPGIYRAFGRKQCAVFEYWQDVIDLTQGKGDGDLLEAYAAARTIVLDTVGAAMKKMADSLVKENAKNGNRLGGLSLAGYGVLANGFSAFVNSLYESGKDLVMVAQEDSEKRGDENFYHPSFIGQKFYNVAMEYADMVGYMHFDNGRRVIDFTPTDRWFAKVPPTNWGQIQLPDFKGSPEWLGKLVAEAKASMGRISEESAKTAGVVDEWAAILDPDTCSTATLNGEVLDKFKALGKKDPTRPQVWNLILAFAKKYDLTFDDKTKTFVGKESAA